MSKFQRKIEKTAKSVDEAVNAALAELGVTREMVNVDIIEEGAKGFLGFGAKDAKVCVTVVADDTVLEDAANDDTAEVPAVESAPMKTMEPKKDIVVDPARVDKAVKFLSEVFEAMGVEVTIDTSLNGDMLGIDLKGDNMGIIIGKRGDTLDSLQYLTSLVVNHKEDDYVKVTLDTENYREKRTQALLQLSNRLADKVAKSGKKYTLEPMNPYERRVIHSNLQDHEEVTTYSIGDEPYRKVVISPKNPKPYNSGSRRPYNRRRGTGGYKRGYANDND